MGRFAPELAVLHVATQSIDMTTHEARMRVLEALAIVPADRRASYSRIVRAVVSETVREELEQLMKTVIKDDFIDGITEEGLTRGIQQGIERGIQQGIERGIQQGVVQGMAEGRVAGEADAILRVLDARGLKVSAVQRKRIIGCTDLEQLQEWITRAVTAAKVADIFG
jgi:predicted transposase YdaD